MRPKLLATSANRKPVSCYGDSHAARHFDDEPNLQSLVRRAIRMIHLRPDCSALTFDFRRVIGQTDLVQTGPEDQIVYARRSEREGYTRFAKDREQPDCTTVALVFRPPKHAGQGYLLTSAWIGPLTPPFPNKYRADQASLEFWANHALVWGSQAVIASTETSNCPW